MAIKLISIVIPCFNVILHIYVYFTYNNFFSINLQYFYNSRGFSVVLTLMTTFIYFGNSGSGHELDR